MKTFHEFLEYMKVANAENSFPCYVNYDLLGFLLTTLGFVGQYEHVPFLSNSGLDMDSLKPMDEKETIEKIHDIARQSDDQGDGYGVTRTGRVYLDLSEIQSLKKLMHRVIDIGNRIIDMTERGVGKGDKIAWKNTINSAKQQLVDVSLAHKAI
jgi:hypothetical protein